MKVTNDELSRPRQAVATVRRARVHLFLAATLAAAGPGSALAEGAAPTPRGPASVIELRPSSEIVPSGVELRAPESMAVDHTGSVLIADTGNHRVVVVSERGEAVREFGGYGWEEDRLDAPSDLSIYPGFFVYVLDEGNRRVVRYDVYGDFVDTVIAEGEAGSPVAMAVGRAGELYLVDSDSQTVRSFSQFDEVLESVGEFGPRRGGLVDPTDIAVGPSGRIAVADRGRGRVEVFDEFGSPLFSLAVGDTMSPAAVVFDRHGNLLVADAIGPRVIAFPRGGGLPTASIDVRGEDGFELAALCLGASGELLVLDRAAARILVIEAVYGDAALVPKQ